MGGVYGCGSTISVADFEALKKSNAELRQDLNDLRVGNNESMGVISSRFDKDEKNWQTANTNFANIDANLKNYKETVVKLSDQLNSTISDINDVVSDLKKNDENLNKVLKSSAQTSGQDISGINDKLDSALKQLSELMDEISSKAEKASTNSQDVAGKLSAVFAALDLLSKDVKLLGDNGADVSAVSDKLKSVSDGLNSLQSFVKTEVANANAKIDDNAANTRGQICRLQASLDNFKRDTSKSVFSVNFEYFGQFHDGKNSAIVGYGTWSNRKNFLLDENSGADLGQDVLLDTFAMDEKSAKIKLTSNFSLGRGLAVDRYDMNAYDFKLDILDIKSYDNAYSAVVSVEIANALGDRQLSKTFEIKAGEPVDLFGKFGMDSETPVKLTLESMHSMPTCRMGIETQANAQDQFFMSQ